VKIRNKLFENMLQFRCLGTTVTNQNLIQEKIKRRLNYGNSCCLSVQNLLSFHVLYKSITVIMPVVLYGYETWSLTFKRGREEVTEGWRKLHNEELRNFYSSPNIIRMVRSRRMRLAGHVA
jgi:hypothetical protein